MEKTIEVNGKSFTIKEIKYKDLVGQGEMKPEDSAKVMMQLATGLSDEDYDNLPMKEGIEVQKAINELNGLDSFQKPLTK